MYKQNIRSENCVSADQLTQAANMTSSLTGKSRRQCILLTSKTAVC